MPGIERLDDAVRELGDGAVEELEEDLALVAEVAVQGADADARARGDHCGGRHCTGRVGLPVGKYRDRGRTICGVDVYELAVHHRRDSDNRAVDVVVDTA